MKFTLRFITILSALFATAFALIALAVPAISQASFYPTGGGTYTLQSSISSSQSTVTLTSFREPGSLTPYTMSYINTNILYGTISPSSGNSEFISATGITQNANGTATLTGVIRGLARTPGTGGCVASSTLAHAYPGQTQFILSDSPCFWNQYFVKQNNESVSGNITFTGQTTFTSFPITASNATSSYSAAGISQLATSAQIAAGTATSTNGTNAPLVISSAQATSTYNAATAANKVVATGVTGKIDNNFIATSTLGLPLTASTTIVSTSTSPYTWIKPAGASVVEVVLIAGGEGGDGGAGNNPTTNAPGGATGGYTHVFIPASLLPSTVTVTAGAGGAGGAGGASGAGGNGGTAGGDTKFGSYLTAVGGSTSAVTLSMISSTVGGTGGHTNTSVNGTAGQSSYFNSALTGGTFGASGAANPGTAGLSATSSWPIIGGTGGGGAQSASTNAGNGGNGGLYGAGGGGGGGADAHTGGTGGQGGDGIALIITYF